MRQPLTGFSLLRLFFGQKRAKLLNLLVVYSLMLTLVGGILAEPAQAQAEGTTSAWANVFQFGLSQSRTLYASLNPRAGEFEQMALNLQREDPRQVLLKAQSQPSQTQPANLEKAFQAAATEFNIPVDLLKAASYALSQWEQRAGVPTIDDGYGIMHLVRNQSMDRLGEAAKLIGADPEQLKTDTTLNIRAGAVLLRQKSRELGPTFANASTINELGVVLERWSGFPPNIAQLYIDNVFYLLSNGFSATTSAGETIKITANPGLAPPSVNTIVGQPQQALPPTDYSGAISYPTTKFTPGRNGDSPKYIVIGFGAGSTTSLLNTYTGPVPPYPNRSVHYVVGTQTGTYKTYQLVSEADTAYFLNPTNAPFNNTNFIGISLEGSYLSTSARSPQLYRAVKALVDDVARRNNITVSCSTVVGQGIASPNFSTNPRLNWDWSQIIPGARPDCGGPNPPIGPNLGTPPYALPVGEPVNPQNGNFVVTVNDIVLPGNGNALSFTRTYNSLDTLNDSPFGPGWSFSLNIRLEPGSGSDPVTVYYADGRFAKFTLNSDGNYKPEAGFFDKLVKNADGSYTLTRRDQVVLQFRGDGKLLSQTDRNGNRVSLSYDNNGNLSEIKDAAGRSYSLSYNANGKITTIADSTGRKVQYTYNATNGLESVTDPKGATTRYSYDTDFLLLSITDGKGQTFVTNQYDGANRVMQQTDPAGKTFRYEYDGNVTRFYDQLNNLTTYEYDEYGRPTKTTDAKGGVTQYSYDDQNNLIKYITPEGRTWQYSYDAAGNRTGEIDPLGHVTKMEYDSQSNLVKMIDAKGQQSGYEYDAGGNLTKMTQPDGSATSAEYDKRGRLVRLIDPRGNQTRFFYDDAGNLVRLVNALDQATRFEYDGLGRLVSVIDAKGRRTTNTYDAAGNRTGQTDALGREMKFEYDAENNLIALTDRTGARSTLAYNFNNQQVELKNPLGHAVSSRYNAALLLESNNGPRPGQQRHFEYDALHQKVGEYDGAGRLTAYEYDKDGNIIKKVGPDGAVTRYQYDQAGRLQCLTDAVNATRCVEYDELNRVITSKDGRGNPTTYEYDALGRMLKMNLPVGQFRYEYDANGNLTKEIDPLGRTGRYEYDALNRRVKVIDPAGGETRYEYDEAGQLISVTDPRGFTSRYEYDAGRRLVKVIDPVGKSTRSEYDNEDRLTKMIDQLGRTTSYEYNAAGQLVKQTDPAGGVQTFEYDEAGNLIVQRSPAGRPVRYSYNLNDELISLTDGLNRVTKFEYDAAGRVGKQINPKGQSTEMVYDGLGRLLVSKDAKGGLTSYEYDADGNLTRMKDALGQETRYEYDALGRMLKQIDPLGGTYQFSYDAAGQMTGLKKPRGGTISFGYDALGRNTQLSNELGATSKFSYDAVGNLVESSNPRGATYKREYDELGRMTKLVDPFGIQANYAYDAVDQLTRFENVKGQINQFKYDRLGRLTESTDAKGGTQKFEYDADGLLTASIDQLGRKTLAEYDAAGQLSKVTSPRGAETKYSYDAAGNRIGLTNALGNKYSFEYDAVNQLTAQLDPLGNRTEYVRDALSRLVTVKNPRGFVTSYGYDALNRLTNVTDAKGGVTGYTYDAEGNLSGVKDARGNQTGYSYDLEGHLTGVTDALNNSWQYSYDLAGNLTGTKDARGRSIKYEYDPLNRLTAMTYPDGFVQKRAYDGLGNLIELIDRDGSSTFDYDELNRQINEDREARPIFAKYDAVGNLTRLENSNGQTYKFNYNADNQLEKITDPRGGQYAYQRDLLGRVSELSYPNGAKTVRSYDAADRLTSLLNQAPGNKLLNRYDYTLDQNGNRTQVTTKFEGEATATAADDAGFGGPAPAPAQPKAKPAASPYSLNGAKDLTSNFSYDELDRLASEKYSTGLSVNYDFDPNGNITRKQFANPQRPGDLSNFSQTLSYDSLNHLTRVDQAGQGQTSFGYDANGNRISKKDGLGETRYSYDDENRLTMVETPKGNGNGKRPQSGVAEYSYDGLGRLQHTYYDKKGQDKDPNGADISRLYWGLQLVSTEANGKGQNQGDNYFTIGEDGAILGSLNYDYGDNGTPRRPRYYQQDGLGSTVVATNQQGKVVGSQNFSPYGEQFDDQNLDALPNLGFTGQEYDDRTGLTHFYARWLDTTTGRWLNDDPYPGQQGQPITRNHSLYVNSNPVNLTDALGFFAVSADKTSGIVQSGDTLWGIAQQVLHNGNRWGEIYNLNKNVIGSNPNLIFPGTKLSLPGAGQEQPNGRCNPGNCNATSTSQASQQMIKQFEGLVLHVYNDGAGWATIGYGHLWRHGDPTTISVQQADAWFAQDLRSKENDVNKFLNQYKVTVNQNQFDALVSFAYNLGAGYFWSDSVLKNAIIGGNIGAVQARMSEYVHGGGKVMPGLVRRRNAEAALYGKPMVCERVVTHNVPHLDQVKDYTGKYKAAGAGYSICSAASLTEALQYYLGPSIKLNDIADWFIDNHKLTIQQGLLNTNYLVDFVNAHQSSWGLNATYQTKSFDCNWIASQLDQNKLIIANVPGHFTLITGYRLKADGTYEFQMDDPFRGHWSSSNVNSVLNKEWITQSELAKIWQGRSVVIGQQPILA
jgi:RHS repeat-associated protein